MNPKWKRMAARRAPWNTLLCSASDGSDDDNGGGGGSGDGSGGDDPVKKLTAKVDEILGEKKKLAEKVRAYEAAEAERKAEEAKREEDEARKKGEWDKIENGYKTKLSEAESEAYLWKGKYFDRELDLGLTEALNEANVKPELRKAAMALLRNSADIDEDGKITLGEKPLADAMKDWVKSDEGKAFIANGASGGGANGSGKDRGEKGATNPWEPGKINLTEQGRIYRENKALAIELAAAHGVKLA